MLTTSLLAFKVYLNILNYLKNREQKNDNSYDKAFDVKDEYIIQVILKKIKFMHINITIPDCLLSVIFMIANNPVQAQIVAWEFVQSARHNNNYIPLPKGYVMTSDDFEYWFNNYYNINSDYEFKAYTNKIKVKGSNKCKYLCNDYNWWNSIKTPDMI